mgnify:CR=1 FL=1
METAETLILDALKEIVAIPAEAAVDAYKAQAGIFYLNLMMFELSAVGVNLGYTTVNSLGDLITVDDGAIEGIVKNLAIEISPLFKGTLTSPDLFEQAQSSLETLRQKALQILPCLVIYRSDRVTNTGIQHNSLTIKKLQYSQKIAATLPQSQYES